METEKKAQAETEEHAPSVESAEKGEISNETPQENGCTIRNKKWTTVQIVGCIVYFSLIVLAIVLGVTLGKNKDGNSSEAGDETTKTGGASAIPSEPAFAVVEGPINSTIELLNSDIVNGYKDEEELKKALSAAASFFVSNVILRNSGDPRFQGVGFGNQNPFNFREGPVLAAPGDDTATPTGSEKAPDPVGDDVDSYGTNLQEAGVKEGDRLVSDGKFVYAAYGEYLLVWRADDGEIVTQIQMPTFEDMQRTTRKLTSVPYYWNPRPEIVSLLYHEGRLLVIVQGYGHLWSEAYAQNSSSSSGSTSYPILYDYQATYGRVYSTSSLVVGANDNKKPTLDLVADFNINGLFKGVRAIDGHVHIVTTSGVDTYTELVGPFERWNYPTNVSTEQYIEQATEHADVRIKGFVDSLVEQLKGTTGRLPDNLARLNLWDRISSGTSIERLTYHNGLVNTIAMVHSLDMTADKTGIQPSVFKSSAAFVPSYDVEVYSSQERMVLASHTWSYHDANGESSQSTVLLGLDLDEASTSFYSVGKVAGHILNSYSVDVVGDTLRIATSSQFSWFLPVDFDTDEFDAAVDAAMVEPESRTSNYVILLDMDDSAGVMKELGRLKLGKPNELFTAVRFYDNIAYAVTFERRDPLYVLNLNDASKPEVVGELDISGFSSYLHSINDDNSLILAIGQEADDEGNVLGLKITLFDVSDPTNPIDKHNLYVEKDPNTWSTSDSLWDYKATRYAAERLIIPMDISSPTSRFRGFKVYIANEDMIAEECQIDHGPDKVNQKGYGGCYSCYSHLPRRSFIFKGDLMTTEGHRIISTDLGDCTRVWNQTINVQSGDDCCGYWY